MARQQKLPFLSLLRRAISKVRFLIAFDPRQWLLLSSATATGGKQRRLSLEKLQSQSPGLLDCAASAEPDDIDQRAEDFIERFYRQLRMERQVSLELTYCKGKDV